jgi:hypothetical protein
MAEVGRPRTFDLGSAEPARPDHAMRAVLPHSGHGPGARGHPAEGARLR